MEPAGRKWNQAAAAWLLLRFTDVEHVFGCCRLGLALDRLVKHDCWGAHTHWGRTVANFIEPALRGVLRDRSPILCPGRLSLIHI